MAKLRRKSTPPTKSPVSKPKAKPASVKAKPLSRPKTATKNAVVSKSRAKPKLAAKAPAKAPARPPVKAQAKTKAPAKAPAKAPTKAPTKVPTKVLAKVLTKVPVKASPREALAHRAAAPARAVAKPPTPPLQPPRRSTYVDAVAMYERGVRFLQARNYREASDALKSVISLFPEEKELHERALLYIRVCERGIASAPSAKPESAEDRVYAATLAINNGALDQAIAMLTAVIQKDPDHDQAAYMLGVAHALHGNTELALLSLARSMALNHENRALAYKEPDLEFLRRTDEMRALLASPPAQLPRKDRAPAAKPRR